MLKDQTLRVNQVLLPLDYSEISPSLQAMRRALALDSCLMSDGWNFTIRKVEFNDQQFCLICCNQPKNSPKNDVIWVPETR